MKNKVWILIVALPIALMAVLLSPNEYADQGITAVDCDGPMGVMIFALPAYVIYGVGSAIYAKQYLETKRTFPIIILVFCLCIMAAITPNVVSAIKQHQINKGTEECGKHW